MKKLLPLLAVFFPAAAGNASESDVVIIREQLREIAAMVSEGRPSNEMAAEYITYFSAEPTLLPPDGPAIIGRKEVAEFYERRFAGVRIFSSENIAPEIVVEGDMATRRYFGIVVLMDPIDDQAFFMRNRYLDVLMRKDGEWKILWQSWVPISWEQDESLIP